jgi:membrane protease YdiL (CAAX protease family)
VTTDASDAVDAPAQPVQRWGLVEPLAAFVAAAFAATSGAVVAAVATGAELTDLTLATTAGGLVGMWGVYLLTWRLLSSRRGSGRPVRDIGLRLAGWRDVALGVAAGIVTAFVLVNVTYVLLQAAGVISEEDTGRLDDPARELGDMAGGGGFVVLALLVGIGAPVVEEIFFRGLLQPAAVRRFGPAGGVAFTALFFGAAHLQPLQFPALAVFGLVLGVLAHRTGRLGPGIVAHVVFNGLTLVALATGGSG